MLVWIKSNFNYTKYLEKLKIMTQKKLKKKTNPVN